MPILYSHAHAHAHTHANAYQLIHTHVAQSVQHTPPCPAYMHAMLFSHAKTCALDSLSGAARGLLPHSLSRGHELPHSTQAHEDGPGSLPHATRVAAILGCQIASCRRWSAVQATSKHRPESRAAAAAAAAAAADAEGYRPRQR
jgi:hypothetical protein